MPPRRKSARTLNKSAQKPEAHSETGIGSGEGQNGENQANKSTTTVAALPPLVEPESATGSGGSNLKQTNIKSRKTSADKAAEEELEATGDQQSVTGALKKLVDLGYAVHPPGTALYKGGRSKEGATSAQADTEKPADAVAPAHEVAAGLEANASPPQTKGHSAAGPAINSSDENIQDHPQTPVAVMMDPLGETPQIDRGEHVMRTVEFEFGAGKDTAPDVFSAKVPIYPISSGNQRTGYQIPTRESLKILSEFNTPLKDRCGDIWRLERGRRIRLGQVQKLLGDEEVKSLALSNIGWMPLEEEGQKLIVKLEWGQQETYSALNKEVTRMHPSGSAPAHHQAMRPSGSAPPRHQAKPQAATYVEMSSDLDKSEDEASALTAFLRLCLDVPAVDSVPKSDITAGHLFLRWRVLQEARTKMKTLGWQKRGVKNMYIVKSKNSLFTGTEIGQQELGDLVGVRKSTVSNDESIFKKATQIPHLWVDATKNELKPEYEGMAPAAFKETVDSAFEKLKIGDGKVEKPSKKKPHKRKHSKKHPMEEEGSSERSSKSGSSSESEGEVDKHKRRKHK